MLINKVSDIARNIQVNPKLFEDIQLILKETGPDAETQVLILGKQLEIDILKEKIEALKLENVEILDENEEFSEKVDELESELEEALDEVTEYEQKLEELETELTALKAKRGIQIVAVKDMPDELQKVDARNKEITPLMARLHSEMSIGVLSEKSRAKVVKQLCRLDDERRSNWDKIDNWSQGKTVEPELKAELNYDTDPLIAGAQMARRVLKLQENIKNSQATYDGADREVIKENALKRIAVYKAELDELELKLAPAKTEESAVE
jgi:chromosome segregation ATPase